jgi:hypothetical protein
VDESYETSQPLSTILDELLQHPQPRITVAELSERFGGRALGALLFIFALACTLPLPPGASTIFGAPLLLLAPQLVIGNRTPWLPAKLRERSIQVADLRKGLPGVIRLLRKVESVSRPRLAMLFGPVGDRVIGVVCTLLACVLVLPIWGGNLLPGAAVAFLSLSMVQRDGVLALVGYVLTITSVSVLVLAFNIIAGMFRHALTLMTAG